MSNKAADPLVSAEAAVQSARAELEDTRDRLAHEEKQTDELVSSWVEAADKDREAIERRQQSNAVAKLNLKALVAKLESNVGVKEQAVKEARRGQKVQECLSLLAEAGQAGDRIRAATRELLLAHCEYQRCKVGFEVERGHLRGLCPGGELKAGLGQDTPEQIAISKGPKLAQELRSLALYTRSDDTLRHLESCGALKGDEEPLRQRLLAWGQRIGIGPVGNIPPTVSRVR